VRIRGTEPFGTKVEVKNLNSFRFLKLALEYEIARQVAVIDAAAAWRRKPGCTIRTWGNVLDAQQGRRARLPLLPGTRPDAATHRRSVACRVRASMPELPARKRARFAAEFGLREYDAEVLTQTRAASEYFETAAKVSGDAKSAANWVMGDLMGLLKAEGKEIADRR